jgi:RNA-binding protein
MLHGGMIPCRRAPSCAFVDYRPPAPPIMTLKPTQKRYLRGLAHALKPVIQLGNKGITDALIAELVLALEHHELIKVRLGGDDRAERAAQIERLAAAAQAEVVQSIGKVATFYRRNDDTPKIALPR